MNGREIKKALERFGRELLQQHQDSGQLAFIGIRTRGLHLAKRLCATIKKMSGKEIPLGESKSFLDERVSVDRTPSTVQLTTSAEEQDFPAIAQSGDDVYVAYVEFTHGDRSKARLGIMDKEPASFDYLARPAGGDQVMLLHYSKSRNAWDPPRPVSAARQDVMRAAVRA